MLVSAECNLLRARKGNNKARRGISGSNAGCAVQEKPCLNES